MANVLGLVVGLSLFGIGLDLGGPTTAPASAAPIECQVTGALVCTNRPPTARIETVSSTAMSVTVCDRSSDPEDRPMTRRWQFGDGATSAAECPKHTYASPGEYTITLTVEDDAQQTDSTTTIFRAQPAAPPPSPTPGSTQTATPTPTATGTTGGTSTGSGNGAPGGATAPPRRGSTSGSASGAGSGSTSGSASGGGAPGAPSETSAPAIEDTIPSTLLREDRHLWRTAISPLVVRGDETGLSLRTVAATAVGMALLFIPPLWFLFRRRRRGRSAEFERLTNDFISNVSHELRTPLTPVRGYAEMLGNKRLPQDKARTAASAILSASARLERVIDQLVDVAEIDSGHAQMDSVPVELGTLTEEVVGAWRLREPARTFDVSGSATVPGSHRLLVVALDQLLDNAVKFSSAGSPVAVEVTADKNGVAIAVTDRGEGVAPENLETIFADFRQGDGSATREHGGLGLGLSLVRRVARAHGGDITVRSVQGQGSTFTMTLPTSRARRRRVIPMPIPERSPVRT